MSSIRQQINIAASTRAVWRAITTADGLKSWWVDEARVDQREGGRVVVSSEDDEGNTVEEFGILHTLRPTRKVEIFWDKNSPAPTKGTRISFQLASDRDETKVLLIHSGGGILEDEEERASLEKGWRQALKSLRDVLEN